MSISPAMLVEKQNTSGANSVVAVMQPRISAAATIAAPAGVIGAVAPRIGIGAKLTGKPYLRASSSTSQERLSTFSGDVVQYAATKIGGCLRKVSRSPPVTRAARSARYFT